MRNILSAIGFVLLCSACNADGSEQQAVEQELDIQAPNDDPDRQNRVAFPTEEIFVGRLSDNVGMPEALMTGVLTVEDGCLVFKIGGTSLLAMLPQDASLDEANARIRSLSGDIPLNRELQFGGGTYPASHEIFSKLDTPPPSTCPKEGAIIGNIQ